MSIKNKPAAIIFILFMLAALILVSGCIPSFIADSILPANNNNNNNGSTADAGDNSGNNVNNNTAGNNSNNNAGGNMSSSTYVGYPPEQLIPCDQCDSGKAVCFSCEGEGEYVLIEGSPGEMLPGGFYMPEIPRTMMTCSVCEGKGETNCYTCDGTNEMDNPDYELYCIGVVALFWQSGETRFQTDPSSGYANTYISVSECPGCKGTTRVICPRCNGAREYPETVYVGSGFGDNGGSFKTQTVSCSMCGGIGDFTCDLCFGLGSRVYVEK